MEAEFHTLAVEFCRLIDAPDLLAWLRLPPDTPSDAAVAALREQRKRLQGMQSNPKYREPALFLIKHYRALEAVLQDPGKHLREVRLRRDSEKLPLLELAVDGILADGVVTAEEIAFLREQATSLGVSGDVLDALLAERARQEGVVLPDAPPPPVGLKTVKPRPVAQEARGAAGKGWWDARLTRLLLECVPPSTGTLVDVACGLAWSALTLLPHLPTTRWIGVDEGDAELVTKAVRGSSFAERVSVRKGSAAGLPVDDATADVALSVMTLQRHGDTRGPLRELVRVLRPGGTAVVLEPDALTQAFWFDGDLFEFNAAFRDLCALVDRRLAALHRNPDPLSGPGIALGPRVAARLADAGLRPTRVVMHPVQDLAWEPFEVTVRRLTAHATAMTRAANLADTEPVVQRVRDALSAVEGSRGPEEHGFGGHVLPTFLVVATR